MTKILIANRGEIALRILRACEELQIKSLLIYSEADKNTLPVKLAPETFCIGPASSLESYLHQEKILEIAKLTQCTHLHPGYGFLSENASFVQRCEEENIIFIGPPLKALEVMGDKLASKEFANNLEVPTLKPIKVSELSQKELLQACSKLSYPLLIKASGGGGGKGMEKILHEDQLLPAISKLKKEAYEAFGNDTLFIEKYIQHPRHIEIQILGDQQGNIIHLGERDCTIQRKFQKIIEEAPALTIKHPERIYKAALKIAQAIGYYSAGTMEFLYDQETDEFYFMEMNTRIQVEHPVTEELTGIDLVKSQILISLGQHIPTQKEIQFQGHVIELRINAEHPFNLKPSPKFIDYYRAPSGPGIRVDDYIYSGYQISPFYDSLLAKIIIKDSNRDQAIKRARRALEETFIIGPETNIALHKKILQDEDFQKNNYSTSYLQEKISSFEQNE